MTDGTSSAIGSEPTAQSPLPPRDEERSTAESVTGAILSRRSVRVGLDGTPIPISTLQMIVRCGLAAPSSKNARPWRLHVVTGRSLLRELAMDVEAAEGADSYVPRDPSSGKPRSDWPSTVVESAGVLRDSSAAIFVENRGMFSDGRRNLSAATKRNLVGSLVGYTFEVIGIGAAIENMFIAAHALGVQGAFMGDVVIAESRISRRLGIELDLVGVLALGYSDAPRPRDRVVYDVDDHDRVIWHGGNT
jgi:nitroreductase